MRDHGIRRNASGYIDEPCYQAAKAGAQPGEIWACSLTGDYRLIVSNNGETCIVLKLYDTWREDEVRVMARVPMWANPLKICYLKTADLTTYIKSVPEKEFDAIHRACVRALGGTGARP